SGGDRVPDPGRAAGQGRGDRRHGRLAGGRACRICHRLHPFTERWSVSGRLRLHAQNPPGWRVIKEAMSDRLRVNTAVRPLMIAMALGAAAALTACDAAAQSRGNIQAEQSRTLRERLYERGLPDSGRFVTSTGIDFILDRSGPRTLIRFEG